MRAAIGVEISKARYLEAQQSLERFARVAPDAAQKARVFQRFSDSTQ